MKSIETSGKTIDLAVSSALQALGVKQEDVEIEVLQEGKRGVFGLGASNAIVRVTVKELAPAQAKPVRETPIQETPVQKTPVQAKPIQPKPVQKAPERVTPAQEKPVQAQSVMDAQTNAEKAEAYLTTIFTKLALDMTPKATENGDTLNIQVDGDSNDAGRIIGRRGDTLDALQYLCSLVVNRGAADYIRVNLDTENYRKKREDTLVSLARRMAKTVEKTHRSVTLEPMNPNERRIIHATLQSFPNVTTYSTGEDPDRRIVIATKKKKEYGSDYVSKYRYNRKENECVNGSEPEVAAEQPSESETE